MVGAPRYSRLDSCMRSAVYAWDISRAMACELSPSWLAEGPLSGCASGACPCVAGARDSGWMRYRDKSHAVWVQADFPRSSP